MDAKATCWFRDRETGRVYGPGQAYYGSAARVRELARAGLVEAPRRAAAAPAGSGEEAPDGAACD